MKQEKIRKMPYLYLLGVIGLVMSIILGSYFAIQIKLGMSDEPYQWLVIVILSLLYILVGLCIVSLYFIGKGFSKHSYYGMLVGLWLGLISPGFMVGIIVGFPLALIFGIIIQKNLNKRNLTVREKRIIIGMILLIICVIFTLMSGWLWHFL